MRRHAPDVSFMPRIAKLSKLARMGTRRSIPAAIAALAFALLTGFGWPCRAVAQIAAPAIPAGMARVWFLRLYEPYVSLATPMLFVNGAPLTASQPGTAFYRDLVPGTYAFSVASYGIDQGQTLPLFPDEEVYFIIWCDPFLASGRTYQRDTFYVVPLPPPAAWQYMQLPDMRDLGAD